MKAYSTGQLPTHTLTVSSLPTENVSSRTGIKEQSSSPVSVRAKSSAECARMSFSPRRKPPSTPVPYLLPTQTRRALPFSSINAAVGLRSPPAPIRLSLPLASFSVTMRYSPQSILHTPSSSTGVSFSNFPTWTY